MKRGTLEAIVKAAHVRGKLAVVHVLEDQKAREAIAAGPRPACPKCGEPLWVRE
jgi:hypothetical protein